MFGIIKKRLLRELKSKEYREGYVEGHVRGGIAHQITALREGRGWSQAEFARRLNKPQSVVNRLENPEYGKFSLTTLLEVANSHDVGLMVRFVSFGELVERYSDLSPEALNVISFEEDAKLSSMETVSYTSSDTLNRTELVIMFPGNADESEDPIYFTEIRLDNAPGVLHQFDKYMPTRLLQ